MTAATPRELRRLRANDVAFGVPIAGFTGPNGAGKTLLAVTSAAHDIARGRKVYSTVPIHTPWGDSEPIVSLRQLLQLRDCTILLDEVAVIFSSRQTASLPSEIVTLLQTLRHVKNTLRWTAPAWMRCDNLIREVTQGLVNVVPLARRHEDGNPWPTPRIVLAGLLDTSVGKVDETPTKIMRRRLAIPSRLAGYGAYDTHADTPLLGRRKVGGRCVDCGGSMETPKHSEKRHQDLGLPYYPDDALLGLPLTPAVLDDPPALPSETDPADPLGPILDPEHACEPTAREADSPADALGQSSR